MIQSFDSERGHATTFGHNSDLQKREEKSKYVSDAKRPAKRRTKIETHFIVDDRRTARAWQCSEANVVVLGNAVWQLVRVYQERTQALSANEKRYKT